MTESSQEKKEVVQEEVTLISVEELRQARIKELPNAEFYYFPNFIGEHWPLFQWLLENLPWTQQRGMLYGKSYDEPRKKCIFSLDAGKPYTYGSITTDMLPFPEPLEFLRAFLVKKFGVPVNSCIANLYRDGNDCVQLHRDGEATLVPDTPILSITLGAVRHFDVVSDHPARFGTPPGPIHDRVRLDPISGSLIVMARNSQRWYKHEVKRQKKVKHPRINLTFRCTR